MRIGAVCSALEVRWTGMGGKGALARGFYIFRSAGIEAGACLVWVWIEPFCVLLRQRLPMATHFESEVTVR